MSLLVFTPTIDDQMQERTVASIKAQETDVPHVWEVSHHNPFPGQKMRNVVAQYQRAQELLLAGDYDALLTVEHDMILPPDAIQKLYHTDAPVVYGVYMLRHGVPTLSAWQYVNDSGLGMTLSLYPKELQQHLKRGWARVSGVGWGCTLIRRSVLEKLRIHTANETDAGDLTFATECLRNGIKQIARFDVECGHILPDGSVLWPFKNGGKGIVARVLALQTVNVTDRGETKTLKKDRYYTLETLKARDLARAGYVRITNDDTPIETTEASTEREMAVAPVQKRRPKKGK